MRGTPAIPPVALLLLAFLAFLAFPAFPVLGPTPSPAVAAGGTAAEGWTAERVRFEPLDDTASLGLVDGHDYRGVIEVARPPDAQNVVAMNVLGLQEYLRGISEVPVGWPLEAQKAQAIAARTFVLHEMGRDISTTWRMAGADTCATQACQVYAGLAKERRPGAEHWTAAVDATEGQVLVHDGAPILAKYSSSNGGQTVSGGRSYLPQVDDPDDVSSPLNRWQSRVGLGEVAGLYELGDRLRSVRSAGTIIELTEELPEGEVVFHHVAAPDFRDRLNAVLPALDGLPYRLPSNRYSAWTDAATGTVFLEGGGYGHGIGMSQYGALGKARRGMAAADILAAYYGGLRPVTVPPGELPDTVSVAVADQPEVGISSAGRFRVVDQDGRVLAHVATGQWILRAAGDGVEVIPPDGQRAAPVVDSFDVDPPVAGSGEAAVVRFRLSAPALVDVTLSRPSAPDVVFERQPTAPGEHTYRLPVERRGEYVMTVVASAGEGREARVPIRFEVGELPTRAVPSLARWAVPAPSDGIRTMVALAGTAWLIVLAAFGALRPRLH